ncbi:sulfate transporter family-domain-containing protein [Halteromyces radiatus]|uniref:sulfate transporter family-domain-containing protein n=1 Tax=Halteromyces radiatus TaxID=101107 RepID=UPI00221F2D5B|nr:sulfate transporter family-domain-containing protein [Halteromyces radiatus]KAI8089044.1 sulfate transporter family-domain-containing protein [Halteromyces radiatus]
MVKDKQKPLDIKDTTMTSPIQDLPSRSYYSSHIHHESGNTEDSLRYSASIESIRAQSLALGDICMTENKHNEEEEEQEEQEQEQEDLINSETTPTTTSTSSIEIMPTSNGNSNLSFLLQKYNQDQHEQERQPLLSKTNTPDNNQRYQAIETSPSTFWSEHRESIQTLPDLKDIPTSTTVLPSMYHSTTTFKTKLHDIWLENRPTSWKSIIIRPLECIPSVILGLLLNLLDAISYGMITFPLNNPIFASFGPEGISMFFVSCIIAQLVYTGGGSAFDGVNGSMMIEVVPFLHIMAESIVQSIGEDQPAKVISSTMVAFALSSIMTGVAFFLLGALKLGSLIEFFPRHILVATIGGVGWFLVATGIEVSGRLDEDLTYTWAMFKHLFLDVHVFSLWFSAFLVAILLRCLQHRFKSPMVVPLFFMILPLAFYLVILIFGWDINQMRDDGWIFPLVDSNVPFWHFYTYYDFSLVDWKAVAQTLPAMLALTFFGLLHVPINVPALAVSTNKDDVDVNRELVAHGISNALSGCFGAVQNYLVYTNSLLFIRSGGDSRLAGLMLAGATAILWMVGPWIVGYIPVMVVGSLIFHLGLDLLKEALIDTWNCVHYFEYITICVIVACMATLGFVEGIFIGIMTACLFFVVQNARRSETIRATFTGQIMRSTVRRLYRQQVFLNQVASQIQVIKLQGYLFFGTINQVERAIRAMLDDSANNKDDRKKDYIGWNDHPIRFLVLDLQLVQGLDFSAAEAFVRIRRLLASRQVFMILCNVEPKSDEEKALKKAGVWDDNNNNSNGVLKCFEHLDDALEWCENVLLKSYFTKKPHHPLPTLTQQQSITPSDITNDPHTTYVDMHHPSSSPRHRMLSRAVQHLLQETHEIVKPHSNMSQPTLILAQSLGDLTSGTDNDNMNNPPMEFYHTLGQYFERCTYEKGQTIWRQDDTCDFLIVLEQGSLRSLMQLKQQQQRQQETNVTVETILPGTVVGELGLFASTERRRSRSLVADQASVLWKLTRAKFDQLVKDDPTMATQFVLLTLHFSVDRQDTMTKYAFHLHRY